MGEFEFSMLGVNKEQIVSFLCVGVVASPSVGTFFGILSDTMGQKKFVVIFFFLHIFVGVLKRVSRGDPLWLASICLSLASPIFTFSFEAWMVLEHEKQGLKEEFLNDTFWLRTFLGSGCFITTQGLSNWLISTDARKSLTSPSIGAICLAALGIAFVERGWKISSQAIGLHNHDISHTLLFKDKWVVLLTCAQASIQFFGTVFGILWSRTLEMRACYSKLEATMFNEERLLLYMLSSDVYLSHNQLEMTLKAIFILFLHTRAIFMLSSR